MSKKSAKSARRQAQARAARTERQAAPAHGPRPMRKPVSRTPVWVAPAAVVAVLAILVGAFLVYRYYTTPVPPKKPSSATTNELVAAITSIPASEFETVGQGSANNTLKAVSGAPLTGATGKMEVLYIGAEYCPFCAAQRWPLIIALSRFGTFSSLETSTSSSTDVYPNTPTWTFRSTTYTSLYVDFRAVETSDREQKPLESPTAAEQALMTAYDPQQSIPFIDIGNRYTLTGATYSPESLSHKTWQQIADELQNADSEQAKAILGSANLITAAICKATGDKATDVCSSSTIQALEKKLG